MEGGAYYMLVYSPLFTVGYHVDAHRGIRRRHHGSHTGGAAGDETLSLDPLPRRHLHENMMGEEVKGRRGGQARGRDRRRRIREGRLGSPQPLL
eukprot:569725-Hanusia_phi.AAC.2